MASTKTKKSVQAGLHPKPVYVPKVTRSIILVCRSCDDRYIKTRKEQNVCLKCFVKARDKVR